MGLFARFVGIIFSPGATFAAALKAPKPFGILALVAVVVAGASMAPQLTPSGRQAVADMQMEGMERVAEMTGRELTQQDYEAVERRASLNMISGVVGTFVWLPIASLIVTALLWGVFNALLGGTATFKQVLTIVTHGTVIMAVGTAVSMPIMMMQGLQLGSSGPFNLGVLAPMLDSSTFLARFLRGIGVFSIWHTVVVAIGIGVLYKKKAGPIATGLLVLYLVITAGMVAVFGGLMDLRS
jgi:hypothetical protein